MQEISLFYGIRVTMNWIEHNPPHFHVEYAEYRATVLNPARNYRPRISSKQAMKTCSCMV